MTIYSGQLDTEGAENRSVYDFQTGYMDSIADTATEGVHDIIHGGTLGRIFETETAKLGAEGQRAMLAGYGVPVDQLPEQREIPEVPIADARQRVKEAGLEKQITLPQGDTIKAPLLDIMLERGKHRAEYAQAKARGPQGFTASALDTGTSLAVGMLDPLNVAASFVPVVGEARWASLMASAGTSVLARAGVRAGIGAVQGGTFAAAFQPLEWYADTQEGRDYSATDALRNIFFGAALFGGLHVVGGAGADVVRNLRGRPLYPFAEGERAAPPIRVESPPDDESLLVRQEVHPFQRAVADLPPTDQENLMKVAVAQVVQGEPVKVEEVLAQVAQHDPRIAESLDIVDAAPSPDAGERAVHDDVYAQLRAAGMDDEQATHNAAIVAARYATRAQRLGLPDAFALYHGEGLSIRGGGEPPVPKGTALAPVSEAGSAALARLHAVAGIRPSASLPAVPRIASAGDFASAVAELKGRLRKPKEPKVEPGGDVVDAEIVPPREFEQAAKEDNPLREEFEAARVAKEIAAAPERTQDSSRLRPVAMDVKAFTDDAHALLGVARQHDGFDVPAGEAERADLVNALIDARDLIDEHAQAGYGLVERVEQLRDELHAEADKVEDDLLALRDEVSDLRERVVDKYNEIHDAHLEELTERREAEEEARDEEMRARGEDPYPPRLPAILEREPDPYPEHYTVLDVLLHEKRDIEAMLKRVKESPAIKELLAVDVDKLDEAAADRLTDAVGDDIDTLNHLDHMAEFWSDKAGNLRDNVYSLVDSIHEDVVRPLLDHLEDTSRDLEERIDAIEEEGEEPEGRTFEQRQRDLLAERETMGQMQLPGTERVTQGELAQRRADEKLKPKAEQKPMDIGLFGDDAAQKTLFQPAQERPRVFAPEDEDLFRHVAPPFYSAVERAVSGAKTEKASAEQWLATIKNTAGVKAEELEWLGLANWLKKHRGPVAKAAIADYIRANAIEVRDVTKGGEAEGPGEWSAVEVSRGPGQFQNVWRVTRPDGQSFSAAGVRDADEAIEQTQRNHPSAGAGEYPTFQVPGGDNYRELLLTLPEELGTSQIATAEARWRELDDKFIRHGLSADESLEKSRLLDQINAAKQSRNDFRGSHWREPNVLAHVRFNDRTIDGKRTLFLEEVQSDWHQQGRRRGYKGAETALSEAEMEEARGLNARYGQRFAPGGELTSEELARVEKLNERHRRSLSDLPDAPFKTTWPELALKRMIRYAAENGYDQVAWTPGHVQAERYDLSKQIRSIDAKRNSDGTYYVRYSTKNDAEGTSALMGDRLSGEQLADHVGKDLADKITQQPHDEHTYSGLDLRVGGEGMAGFYDKMLPAAANKLGKKYGARVGEAKLPAVGEEAPPREGEIVERPEGWMGGPRRFDVVNEDGVIEAHWPTRAEAEADLRGSMHYIDDTFGNRHGDQEWPIRNRNTGEIVDGPFTDRAAAEAAVKKHQGGGTVHTLPITDALREAAVGEGFPLFQRGETAPRGRIMLSENRAIVDLFRSADASTFMHEMGHKWLEELIHDAARAGAPAAIKDDLGVVLRWLGVEKPEDIGTAQHEQWARGFEQYLAEGKAPSARLAAAFERFKEWLASIYRAIAGHDVQVSTEVRAVMDRMLATDEEIASASAETTANKAKAGPRARDPQTWSLFEFFADRGGLKPDPELEVIFGGKNPFVPGFGRLLRKGGMTLDRAREAAVESGYLEDATQQHGGVTESTINHLLEAIDAQARGNRVYRIGNEPGAKGTDRAEQLHHIETEIDAAFSENGLDPRSLDGKLHARVIEIMSREGVSDPMVAYERAVMEEGSRARDEGKAGPTEAIPGWDVPHEPGSAPGEGGAAAQVGGPGPAQPGEAPRAARPGGGAAPRADDERAWRSLAERRDPDAEVSLAASRAAEKQPEPGSIDDGAEQAAPLTPTLSPQERGEGAPPQSKRLKAASQEEAQAIAEFDAAVRAGYLTEDERRVVEDALAATNQDEIDAHMVAERGIACLTAAVG